MPFSWCTQDTGAETGLLQELQALRRLPAPRRPAGSSEESHRQQHDLGRISMAGRIPYLWKEPEAARSYSTAVSLHSHTNQSRETLDFLATLGNQYPVLRPWFRRCERRARHLYRLPLDYAASYWTPPLTPRLAFDLETGQIANRLG